MKRVRSENTGQYTSAFNTWRSVEPPESPIGKLPPEILQIIFGYLQDMRSLMACEETCYWFYQTLDARTWEAYEARQSQKTLTLYPEISKGEIKRQYSLLHEKPFKLFPKELLQPLGGLLSLAELSVLRNPELDDYIRINHMQNSWHGCYIPRPPDQKELLAISTIEQTTHSIMRGECASIGFFLVVKYTWYEKFESSENTEKGLLLLYHASNPLGTRLYSIDTRYYECSEGDQTVRCTWTTSYYNDNSCQRYSRAFQQYFSVLEKKTITVQPKDFIWNYRNPPQEIVISIDTGN